MWRHAALLACLLAAVSAPSRAETIWSCRLDTAQEVARFSVQGDALLDLRGADLMHTYSDRPDAMSNQAPSAERFRILEDTQDALVALRLASKYEPDYTDWLHAHLILIDKHNGRFTQKSVFPKGSVGYAPMDGDGICHLQH